MQTNYDENHAVGLEGSLVDATNRRVVSRLAEGVVDAGKAVTLGTDPTTQRKLIGAVLPFNGIAIQHSGLTLDDSGFAQYADKEGMSILESGRIWVYVDGAVTIDAPAYALIAGDIGRFTVTVGTNIATGGKFKTATAGAGLAILEL